MLASARNSIAARCDARDEVFSDALRAPSLRKPKPEDNERRSEPLDDAPVGEETHTSEKWLK